MAWKKEHVIPGLAVFAVLGFQISLGVYAAHLNKLFYSNFGPFYDSLSYWNTLATIHSTTDVGGFFTEIRRSTVVYPWLVYALLKPFLNFARDSAVWIQVVASATMQLLLLYYFHAVCRRPAIVAFASSCVFSLIAAIFFFNGGLADFRMDLLQYFLFAAVMVNYLIARERLDWFWWALLGVNIGLLCLGRATSPVYLVLIGVVLLGADLAFSATRLKVLVRYLVAVAIASLIAGWFFILNFDYLYYYYVVWNPDANARLPLAESFAHAWFVRDHIGHRLLQLLLCVAAARLARELWFGGWRVLLALNWPPLLFSAASVGYLVLSGSGLNPFVSMLGASGIVLFMIEPIRNGTTRFPLLDYAIVAALAAGVWFNVRNAYRNHTSTEVVSSYIPRRQAIAEIVEAMASTAADRAPREVTYAVMYVGSLPQSAISNTLIYDYGYRPSQGGRVSRDGKTFRAVRHSGTGVTATEWNATRGATDEQKIAAIAQTLNADADFMIVPMEGARLPRHIFTSRYWQAIHRETFSGGNWQRVMEPVVLSNERIVLYRNRGR